MDKKLNIALIDDSFYPMVDGVANVVNNYAKYLSQKHNVTVFTSTPLIPVGNQKFPYQLIRCKSYKRVHWGDYAIPHPKKDRAFMNALNQPFDIIHIHSPFILGRLGNKIAKKSCIPVIATLHTQFDREIKRKFKLKSLTKIAMKTTIVPFFNSVDEVWIMNESVEKLTRRYGFKSACFQIPNGCDFFPIKLKAKNIKTLRAKYAHASEKILLYVGRLSRLKNLKFSLKVCRELKERNFNFKFLIVGRGEDREYLEKTVERYDIKDNVVFVGEVKDRKLLQMYYRIADLFIFPSFYDTAAIVKVEASAMNLPIIYAAGSVTADGVKNDVNGYIAPAEVNVFADRIIHIFRHPSTYKKVAKQCNQDFCITWDKIVAKAEKRYYQVIDEYHQKKNQ